MRLKRKSECKVMTIWISWEHPLFNFEHLDILCAGIGLPSEMLRPFEFLESFRCSISSVTIYYVPESDIRVKCYDHLNSREVLLFNFECLDIFCRWIGHPCEKLWPLEFLRASAVEFRASRYIMRLNWTSEWKVMAIWTSRVLPLFNLERLDILCAWIGVLSEKLWTFEFLESFRFSISSVSIYYAP